MAVDAADDATKQVIELSIIRLKALCLLFELKD
jgi:hypothetical protein